LSLLNQQFPQGAAATFASPLELGGFNTQSQPYHFMAPQAPTPATQ
jgi:hypothetical protein